MKTQKPMKAGLLAEPAVKAEYDVLADEFAIAHELVAARARAGLSQAEVAQRMGTTQSVVARLEGLQRGGSHRGIGSAPEEAQQSSRVRESPSTCA